MSSPARTMRRANKRAEAKRQKKFMRATRRETEYLTDMVLNDRPDMIAAMNLPDDLPDDTRDSAVGAVMEMEARRIVEEREAVQTRRVGIDGQPISRS